MSPCNLRFHRFFFFFSFLFPLFLFPFPSFPLSLSRCNLRFHHFLLPFHFSFYPLSSPFLSLLLFSFLFPPFPFFGESVATSAFSSPFSSFNFSFLFLMNNCNLMFYRFFFSFSSPLSLFSSSPMNHCNFLSFSSSHFLFAFPSVLSLIMFFFFLSIIWDFRMGRNKF
jgi:hypothetical protein